MAKGTIIYIGGFELPDKNAAAHRVLNIGKILRELDYNVVYISIDRELTFHSNIVNTKRDIQGFDSWFVPYPQSNYQWVKYLSDIQSFLRIVELYSDVKAIICYNYQAVALMKIKRYCNKNNIKIIADCSEWYSVKGTNIAFSVIKGIDSFLRMRVIQKQLDGLIVISQFLKQYYKNNSSLIRVPPLVDLSEDKWKLSVTKNDDDVIRFVYAGSPGVNKDRINVLIESLYQLKEFSNYVFYVIGITKEQYLGYYKEHNELIRDLHNKVVFLGRLSHIGSLKYVGIADFSVFIRENNRLTKAGFPTKFVESVSCGTPIITTRNSDLEEYLVEGENGFWIEGDVRKTLQRILSKSKNEIYEIKGNITGDIFDYHLYINDFRYFIETINISKNV
ncbi:hypothetical protein CVD25_00410 [Bacillus canaveralius]|uniref:Uncharacterized protein n=1 Tax=Bacillus canaveralius TaxID=1403243 RepID=A0A2N5GQA6_9BACI|nr:glycosyltransferase [Bacillus canaveralius]PLR85059.1 hypothetical protein CU635_04575 [Bacillus canaveralius]PLS00943.1 hypothetical protein CVD25_00410 [Bacillus canaveralius]RSK54191.1 glycosyltransferase [Bacillus canaveralius]